MDSSPAAILLRHLRGSRPPLLHHRRDSRPSTPAWGSLLSGTCHHRDRHLPPPAPEGRVSHPPVPKDGLSHPPCPEGQGSAPLSRRTRVPTPCPLGQGFPCTPSRRMECFISLSHRIIHYVAIFTYLGDFRMWGYVCFNLTFCILCSLRFLVLR